MAMKGCSAFAKALASLEPHHRLVSEVQSVYSTASADWAISFSKMFLVILPVAGIEPLNNKKYSIFSNNNTKCDLL